MSVATTTPYIIAFVGLSLIVAATGARPDPSEVAPAVKAAPMEHVAMGSDRMLLVAVASAGRTTVAQTAPAEQATASVANAADPQLTDVKKDRVPLKATKSAALLSSDPPILKAVLSDGGQRYEEYVQTSGTSQLKVPTGGTTIILKKDKNMLLVRIKKNVEDKPKDKPATKAGATARDNGVNKAADKGCPKTVEFGPHDDGSDYAPCELVVIYTRDIAPDGTGAWKWAFAVNSQGLQITDEVREVSASKDHPELPVYTVDGVPIDELSSAWQPAGDVRIERYPGSQNCSLYQEGGAELLDIERPGPKPASSKVSNGIAVAPPKVFDTFTLRQMLASTAAQLQSISGFSQSSLLSALGNLQGITRDTSFLSAQVTTTPGPNVSSTVSNGTTNGSSLANTLGTTSSSVLSNSMIQCPPGTLPAVGTSGLPACAAVQSSSTGTNTGNGNVAGGNSTNGSMQVNNGTSTGSTTNNQQSTTNSNATTTTQNGIAGTVAPTPVSTAFAAPTSSLGLSSADLLAEQVQLNSQITTLRLLLQGALSDQYLVKNNRAIGQRQQTTLGFGISLNPPKRFRHAVAEVRVWVHSSGNLDEANVINLLPADKTYNVAKITSHQNAFGAGAVIEPVSVGVSTGRSKDRLYLAKDTDTVALQYQPAVEDNKKETYYMRRSVQEGIGDYSREAVTWQKLWGECQDDKTYDQDATVFGWQFRPVLGADYVQAGERLVYAQLALPVGEGTPFNPRVYIQTRWREYDEKRQVVGAVYPASCSVAEETDPIMISNELRVHDVHVDDMGAGMLKVSARGNFFGSGFSAISSSNVIGPMSFDGTSVQLFAPAASLLMAKDLQLVAEDGKQTPLGRKPRFEGVGKGCSVSADLKATPQPDGNSLVELNLRTEKHYTMADRSLQPLVLIGSQVYGLHETPFLEGDSACTVAGSEGGLNCTYHFLASTTVLHNAGTFRMADLSWTNVRKDGRIMFGPSFSSVSMLVTAKDPPGGSGAASKSGSAKTLPTKTVSTKTKALQAELDKLPAGSKDRAAKQAALTASMKADAVKNTTETDQAKDDPALVLTTANAAARTAAQDVERKKNALDAMESAASNATADARKANQAWAQRQNAETTKAKSKADEAAEKAAANLKQAQTTYVAAIKKERAADAEVTVGIAGVAAKSSATAIYSLTGLDLNSVANTANWNCTWGGCLELFRGLTRFVLAPGNFEVLSKTNAVLSMADVQNQADLLKDYSIKHPRDGVSASEAAATSALASTVNAKLRWIYHATDVDTSTYEWDLGLPAATAAALVSASDVLNVGDSRQIVFSNVGLSAQPLNLMFDGQVLPKETWSYNQSSQKLTVLISTLITKEPGHKEILASDTALDGTSPTGTKMVALPFDVTRR